MYGAFRGRDSGLTDSALRHRVRRGDLVRLFAGVYATPLDAQRPECRWEAALLSVSRGVLFGPTAAAVYGLPVPAPVDEVVHVAVSDRAYYRPQPGRVVHRPRLFLARDVTARRGLAVTTLERNLVDLAACLTEEELVHAVAAALQRRLTTIQRVRVSIGAATGVHGTPRLLSALSEVVPSRNWFEIDVVRGLVREGLPKPELGVRIGTPDGPRYPDGYFRAQRVALEADGAAAHFGLDEWGRGLERDDALAAVGIETVHITYRQWRRNPQRCIQRVTRILDARSLIAVRAAGSSL